jgi:hypothetical protein
MYRHVFLNSALAGGEWPASRPCRFTLRGRSPQYALDVRMGGQDSRSVVYCSVLSLKSGHFSSGCNQHVKSTLFYARFMNCGSVTAICGPQIAKQSDLHQTVFANPQSLAIRNNLSCAKQSQSVCVISGFDKEGRAFPSVPLPTTRPTVSGCTELGELMAGHY